MRRHPSRFVGFATLPTAVPVNAADELERTVREHGFKGALINGHVKGRYLDDQFFWPILERAEALAVPLYLHPTPRRSRSSQPRTRETSRQGSQPCFLLRAEGWHIETAIHVLRLVLSGAFDQYPGLQLIIGHLDETLPFMLPRLEVGLPLQVTKLDRPISAYLRENVHDTFSGFNFTATFLDLLLDRRRTDYVLCRLSLQLDDRGTDFPRQASGEPCRQRADRARQRGAPCATVIRMTDFCANRVSGPLN